MGLVANFFGVPFRHGPERKHGDNSYADGATNGAGEPRDAGGAGAAVGARDVGDGETDESTAESADENRENREDSGDQRGRGGG